MCKGAQDMIESCLKVMAETQKVILYGGDEVAKMLDEKSSGTRIGLKIIIAVLIIFLIAIPIGIVRIIKNNSQRSDSQLKSSGKLLGVMIISEVVLGFIFINVLINM